MLDHDKKSLQMTLEQISEDKTYLRPACFSDEGAFHVLGEVNKHNVRICGSENPQIKRGKQKTENCKYKEQKSD